MRSSSISTIAALLADSRTRKADVGDEQLLLVIAGVLAAQVLDVRRKTPASISSSAHAAISPTMSDAARPGARALTAPPAP